MSDKKTNLPFSYQRGKTKMIGSTQEDRNAMKIDTIMYWLYRIITAMIILVLAFSGIYEGRLDLLTDGVFKFLK